MQAVKNNIIITTSSFNADIKGLLSFNVIKNPYKQKLSEDEAIGLIEKYRPVGIIAGIEPLTKRVLEKAMPELKVISRCGIGLDNVDMETAKKLGIKVLNTPDAPSQAVAELTVAFMLDLLRKVSFADREIRGKRWKKVMGNLLSKQTVGIIGCGRIGSRVAMLCNAFGARVIGYDPKGVSFSYIDECRLDELLKNADIVSLHVTYNEKLHYFINRDIINCMKPNAIIINTSRGGLVDESALAEALKNGKIAGAGLDTFEEEPYAGPLLELPNVVLTSHIGSYAEESRLIMEEEAIMNLLQELASKEVL